MTELIYKSPKHLMAVDCIVFGYEKETLKLLLTHRNFEPARGQWSLIGGWLNENETLEQAASRVLHQITGLKDIYLEQVHVFSDPGRDSGGRVISVVFYSMIRIDKHDKALAAKYDGRWVDFDKRPDLIFDHNLMVESAHEKLKLKASYNLIGKDLLPGKFTILQLRKLYEAIFQKSVDPANFRKKILSLRVLERQTEKNKKDSKKGAFYYRLKKTDEAGTNIRILKI